MSRGHHFPTPPSVGPTTRPTRSPKTSRTKRKQAGVASMREEEMVPGFHLPHELAEHGNFAGTEQVDMKSVPPYVRAAFRRVLYLIEKQQGKAVNTGAAIACLAKGGLHMLESTDQVRDWKRVSEEAQTLADTTSRGQLRLDKFLHGFQFRAHEPYSDNPVRLALRCSEEIKAEIFGVANRVFGCNGNTLFLVCFTEGLRLQRGVHPDFASEMEKSRESFLAKIEERTRELSNLVKGEKDAL